MEGMMKKAFVYWDHIETEDRSINFPEDPEELSEIFRKIENFELSDFCEDCEFEFKQKKVNENMRNALIRLGYKKIYEREKTEDFLISLTKSMENYKKLMNKYKMVLLDIFESIDPIGKYEKDEEKFIMELNPEDQEKSKIVENLKKNYIDLKNTEKLIENSIKSIMEYYAPNLTYVAGPVLGAELISISGGLLNLSMMPASRIQILGAGKSYYLSKKSNRPGPKHGIIFRHPFVHGSKERGKNARWLANKIAIAARIDYYRKQLDENFIKEVKKIMNKSE